jgi:hypothetical protein
MHFLFLFFIFLYSPLGIHSFLNPNSDSQFPLSDVIAPSIENPTSTNPTMAEHDGFRTVAYFVNWVRILCSTMGYKEPIIDDGNRRSMAATINLRTCLLTN